MSQGHIPSHKFISEKHKTKGTLEAEKLLQEIAIFFKKKTPHRAWMRNDRKLLFLPCNYSHLNSFDHLLCDRHKVLNN